MTVVIDTRKRIRPPKSDKYFIKSLDVGQSVQVKDSRSWNSARQLAYRYKKDGKDFETWVQMEGKKEVLIIKRTA